MLERIFANWRLAGQLAGRMLWRDWRSGELGILAFALLVAVGSVTAVGFFVDRVERGLQQQAAELLAADLVISSTRPLSPWLEQQARQAGLQTARVVQFRSVALLNEQPRLVEVKAVDPAYPLRGEVRVAARPFAADSVADGIPARGEAWVETNLLQGDPGLMSQPLQLGNRQFHPSRVLRYEPDRAGDMFSVAPRVMINRQDLAATGLLRDGALGNWRLLIAGPPATVAAYRAAIRSRLQPGERILDIRDGRPELHSALQRAQRFLGLAALLSVMLAGVAVATAAQRFSLRHLDTSAVLRCLGAGQGMISRLFALEMLALGLLVSTAGAGLGLLAQAAISQILDRLFLLQLPAPSLQPILVGYATGLLLLLGFALPPLLRLRTVPPLRVLRRELQGRAPRAWQTYAAVLLSLAALLYWQVQDGRLVWYVLAGLLLTLLLLGLAAGGLLLLLQRLRQQVGVAWRFGLASLARRPGGSVIQVVAFGLAIMVLLLLSSVRNELLDGWHRSLPAETPNHFLINVQADQVAPIRRFFAAAEGDSKVAVQLYPMVRARLTQINTRPVRSEDYASERARHMITREFNLSWAAQPQVDNRIVAGKWWTAADYGKPLLSLEAGLAQTLGIHLGDELAFNINGRDVRFRVSNLREVDWDTFHINFFTVVPPGVLEQEPASWVTSLYLTPQDKPRLAALVKRFPNVTIIDVEAVMNRVRNIMDRVVLAVEFIFLFTLLAGLAVLYAAIQASQDERRFEAAVLRALGARRRILLGGLLAEFLILGGLAGLLGGLSATALAWLLAEQVFHFPYHFNPLVVLAGLVLGTGLVTLAGLLGTRRVLRQPPVESLRQGG